MSELISEVVARSARSSPRNNPLIVQRVFDRDREVTCSTYLVQLWNTREHHQELTEVTLCGWEVDCEVDDNGPPEHRPMPWFARVTCLECLMKELS